MICRICGCENSSAKRRANEAGAVCDSCNKLVRRRKILSREEFTRRYFGAENVTPGIAREFYSDYCASGLGFDAYREQTTSEW